MTEEEVEQTLGEQPDYLSKALKNIGEVKPEPHPFFNKEEDLSDAKDKKVVRILTKEGFEGNHPDDEAIVELSIVGKALSSGKEFENRTFEFVFGRGAVVDGLEMALNTLSQGDEATVTVHKDYCTYVVDNRKSEDPVNKQARSLRVVPPKDETVQYNVKLLYVENFRARCIRQDVKNREMIRLKEEGNEYFQIKRYHTAQKKYEKAVEYTYDDPSEDIMKVIREMEEEKGSRRTKTPELPQLSEEDAEKALREREAQTRHVHLNLCAVRNKLGQYERAIEGCTLILKDDANNVKALFRRSQGYTGMRKYDEATEDLRQIQFIDPENESAREQMLKIERLVSQEKGKQKQMYKKMFNGISEDDNNQVKQNQNTKDNKTTIPLNNVTSLPLVSGIANFFFAEGITMTHIYMLYVSFAVLFGLTVSFIINRDLGIHGYVFIGLLSGLFLSVQWVIYMVDFSKPRPKVEENKKEQ